MGYMHIDNLYKSKDILLFKECYALEKIYGTSAHIHWSTRNNDNYLGFFFGGEKKEDFIKLFDQQILIQKFIALGYDKAVIYGEAYGGKCQGMSRTYGKEKKFIVFDIKIGDTWWLTVPTMERVATKLGLEVVAYEKTSTDLDKLDSIRTSPSVQSLRNIGEMHKKREGIVLRPLIEFLYPNGKRLMAKYKNEDFIETKTKREVTPEQLKVLEDAKEIAEEWVTSNRLTNIIGQVGIVIQHEVGIDNTGMVIHAMMDDVEREAKGEIVFSKEARKAMGKQTAKMFKQYLQEQLRKSQEKVI